MAIRLLCTNAQYRAVISFGFLFAAKHVFAFATRSLFVGRKVVNIITDQRLGLIQEPFAAVYFIKCYAWEIEFLRRVSSMYNLGIKGTSDILYTT